MSYKTIHIINPKPCAYCSSYSNLLEYFSKEILEFFLQKKHICPNCGQKSATATITPLPLTTPKPSNSFELFITSPKAKIQNSMRCSLICLTEQVERVHGSLRDSDSKTRMIDLLIYYEVPQGQRKEVKKFDNI